MTVLQSRNPAHPARCPSNGHGRVRSGTLLSSQIARQSAALYAICCSFINRFIISRPAGPVRSQSHSSPVVLKSP